MRHSAPRIAAAITLAILVSVPASAEATSVIKFDNTVNVVVGSTAADVLISAPEADKIRVEEFDPDDDLVGSAPCPEVSPEVVECDNLPALSLDAFGGSAGDSIEVDAAATFPTRLYGGGGDDVLLGGGGADRLSGNLGGDDIDGRGGTDLVDNGFDNSNTAAAADGADVYRDTGASGTDALNYGFQTVAVAMSVDDAANDGGAAGAEGDDIGAGFEKLRGTTFDDVIAGGPEPETINGSQGNDEITGGAGADTMEGNEGVDTMRAEDGEVDAVIDCDSASSLSQGDGEQAFVDANDPEPQRCEQVTRAAGGGGTPTPTPTPTPGGGTPGGGTPGGGTPGGGTPTPAKPALVVVGPPVKTATVSRMPRLTGRPFASARQQALTALASAEVDLEFRKGCKASSDLEVVKQSPLTNASLPNHARDPVAVKLTTCVAERDFLRDCDLAGLRADLKQLPRGAMDADVASEVLKSVNRCKVDYDVKLAKAADEAKIKLAAQKAVDAKRASADKTKADLRAAITCPIGGALRVTVTEGYTPNAKFLGLRTSGPSGWTIPASPANLTYTSIIDVVVTDAAFRFPETTVFVDADGVVNKGYGPSKRQTQGGRASFTIAPVRTGKIRICVVQETGSDQVLSWGAEIDVVEPPPIGSVYETISGRQIKLTGAGPTAVTAAAARAPRAQAAFLDRLWDAIVSLFDGRSRTVNEQQSSPAPKRKKTETASTKAKLGAGQITLTGRLAPDPLPVFVNPNGTCRLFTPDGSSTPLTCAVVTAPNGQGLVGTSTDGNGLLATGAGNVMKAGPGNILKAGTGTLVGQDGSTLVGQDGGTLVGQDGGTLVGQDGGTLVGQDGATLVGPDGGTLVAAGGGNAIGPALAPLVAAGAGNLVGLDGGTLVPPGGLG